MATGHEPGTPGSLRWSADPRLRTGLLPLVPGAAPTGRAGPGCGGPGGLYQRGEQAAGGPAAERGPLTIEQVAAHLEISVSKVSRIETGQVGATPRDVRDIATLYGVRASTWTT